MSNKNNILNIGFMALISETSVMVAFHYLGVSPQSWLGLMWDVTAVSTIMIPAIVLWLRWNFDVTFSQLGVVAAKTSATIFIAESGLMLSFHFQGWMPSFWQAAFLDGTVFAIMSAPIIFHWAVKPVIRAHPSHTLSLPIQMCLVISFAALMFDLSLPLGVAGGVPYVMLVLVGLWFPYRNAPFVLALVATALTVIGYHFSPPGGTQWMVLSNRGLAIFAIWITAVLATQFKSKTDELAQQRAQLEEALKSEKKYSALQQHFVSLVSHEFRTPLTIIDGSAQRIMRTKDKISTRQLVERCGRIRNAVERMVSMIETTLYASRLDADKIKMHIQPCNIKELVAEACCHQGDISPSHDIRIDLDSIPEYIDADPELLEHIFTNLLSNAVKYAPDNPLIMLTSEVKGDMLLVNIKDQGLGISEDDLLHVTERYFRAETANGIPGTGLGLSVCKEFIEMHGGNLKVESTAGEGSKFTVQLPIGGRD